MRVGVLAQSPLHLEQLAAIKRPGLQLVALDEGCKPTDRQALAVLLRLYRTVRPDAVLVNTRPGARLIREAVRWIPEISQQTFLYVHDLLWSELLEGLLSNLPGATVLVPDPFVILRTPTLSNCALPWGACPVQVVPNMAEVPVPPPPAADDASPVLHLATINPWKGHTHLIDAAARLKAQGMPLAIESRGASQADENLRVALEERIASAGLSEVFRLGGYHPAPEELYRHCLCLVVTSVSHSGGPETFGRTIIEAWANNRAVVAFSAGAPAGLIRHREDGLLVREGDAEGLAAALHELHSDRALRERLAANGRARVLADYTPRKVIPQLLSLLATGARDEHADATRPPHQNGAPSVVLDLTLSLRRAHQTPVGLVRVEQEIRQVLQTAADLKLDFCRLDRETGLLQSLSAPERQWVDTGTLAPQNLHWRPQTWDVRLAGALGETLMKLPVSHNRPPAAISRTLTWRGATRRDQQLAARSARVSALPAGRTVSVLAANPWTMIPLETLQALKQQGGELVMVLHDVLTWEKPHLTAGREIRSFITRMLQTLCLADHLVAVSRHSLTVFREACAERKLVPPPTTVCHPSVPATLLPGAPTCLPPGLREGEGFVLFCSTLEVRKNHFLLLSLWERLLTRLGPARTPRLVFVGHWGWGADHLRLWLERDFRLAGHVLHLPQLEDAALAYLYRHAQFTLFPSLAEGYGMPVAESLAVGTPVITGNHPALLEASQGLMPALDPLDLPAWERTVVELLESPAALAALRGQAKGYQVQAPGALGAEVARIVRGLI